VTTHTATCILQVWDAELGANLRSLKRLFGATRVLATYLSADGERPRLVAGSRAGELVVGEEEEEEDSHDDDDEDDDAAAAAAAADLNHLSILTIGWR
jgi:hypothetical protein